MMNKQRFWTGIGLLAVETIGLAFYGLTLIKWNWLTIRLATGGLLISAVLIYNGIAGLLIWNGSKKDKKVTKQ